MPGFDHSVLTDVGWDALTDAEAGQHIEYTHLEAGSGYVYGGDTEIYGMTELVSKVMDFPITNFSNDGAGQITLVGVISSKNVATGFNFREIGVRCTIDGGPSILYAVANSGDEADYIPSGAESGVVIQTVQIVIKIDRATNVTVVITPGLDVTAQNIGPGTAGAGWFRDKSSQILWFKRLNSPKKTIEVIETPDLITIDSPVIDVNLDMFVALGNPDIFPHFSTIQKALNYLTPWTIKAGVIVTIRVSAGVWHNDKFDVKHLQGSQINIIGTATTTYTPTTAVLTGDRNIRVSCAIPFDDINVGDFILYKNASTVGGICVSGCWQVVAMAADKKWLQYETFFRTTPFPPMGGTTGGSLIGIKTVLSQAPGANNQAVTCSLDLGLLKYVVVTAEDNAGINYYGILSTRGTLKAEWCGCAWVRSTLTGGGRAFHASTTGSLLLYNCFASNCQNGFSGYMSGGSILCDNCVGTCCFDNNYLIQGTPFQASSPFSGGGIVGFAIGGGAPAAITNMQCFYNNYGVQSGDNGSVGVLRVTNSGNPYAGYATNNHIKDIYLYRLSTFIRTDAAPFVYSTSNVAPNVLTADGCYFVP